MIVHSSFLIDTALPAVEYVNSSGDNRAGRITHIPCGSSVELFSELTFSNGMVEVAWLGRKYAVFLEDLRDRGELTELESTD